MTLHDDALARAVRALYDSAEKASEGAYVGDYKFPNGTSDETTLDGKFNLETMTEAAIRAYLTHILQTGPDQKMAESGMATLGSDDDRPTALVALDLWSAMLRALLGQGEKG